MRRLLLVVALASVCVPAGYGIAYWTLPDQKVPVVYYRVGVLAPAGDGEFRVIPLAELQGSSLDPFEQSEPR